MFIGYNLQPYDSPLRRAKTSIIAGPLGAISELANPKTRIARTTTALFAPIATLAVWYAISWLRSPLRKYPGPFWAGFTNLWRLSQSVFWPDEYADTIKKLHEKYGPVLRIGPNTLDLDYPELLKVIYTTDGKWVKTEMYDNNSTMMDGQQVWTIFSTRDQAYHARVKRSIVKYFTLASALNLEPHMDVEIGDFVKHLDDRFAADVQSPKEFDLVEWINYFAWDQASTMTFSKRYGYMDAGRDFDGTLLVSEKTFNYFQVVSQMPWLDSVLDKNPIVSIGPPNMQEASRLAAEAYAARVAGEDKSYDPGRPDYMQHFLDSKRTHPDLVDDKIVMTYLIVNIIAAADTTAITLQAIFYHLMKHPRAQRRVVQQVRSQAWDKDEVVPYARARHLDYLEAVIKESRRLHPVLGYCLERYVPKDGSGLALPDGSVVPAGTGVGLNAYVIGRNKGLFGEDAEEFRPERWLRQDGEGEEAYKTRMHRMNAADFGFGAGSRVCLGRHLATVEVYKVVATLLNRYDMELVDPEREWKVAKGFFMRPKHGLMTRFTVRD
ncbi:Pisatin demethylase [Cladorrhinum samala]|uniref:Pisatin demethylase n=1 Tax=Cladorrhinum samala TaxID=585594 RepID=A0AAV9HUK7_9PEZI|nr:Pisatin demethylase [Cladorrhinum samala]